MFQKILASSLALLLVAGTAFAQQGENENIWEGAFDSPRLDKVVDKYLATTEAEAEIVVVPAQAADANVTIIGSSEQGGYTVTADRTATLSIAQDALSSGQWDEVVVMRPVQNADGSYTLQAVEGLPVLTTTYFEGQKLGMNTDAEFEGFELGGDEFAYAGIFINRGNRGGGGRTFTQSGNCQQQCPQQCTQNCQSRSSGGNCQNDNCNLRPGHIFVNQFKYAFRRAYAKGEGPGLIKRVVYLAAPRLALARGDISCYTAQTLLARRLIAIEATAIGVTAGTGGAALGPIFIP